MQLMHANEVMQKKIERVNKVLHQMSPAAQEEFFKRFERAKEKELQEVSRMSPERKYAPLEELLRRQKKTHQRTFWSVEELHKEVARKAFKKILPGVALFS